MARKCKQYKFGPSLGARILAVDPGKAAGFALFDKRLLVESGALAGDDVFVIWDLVKRTAPDGIVVEDQFIGKNPKTAKVIVLRRGHWETIAALRNIPTATVPPTTWQGWAKVKRGDKPAYYRFACAITGRQLTSEDEAAAVLIGLCYVSSAASSVIPTVPRT